MREIRSFFTPILVLSFLMNVNSQTKTWVLVTKETKEIAKNELTFRKHFPSKSEIYSLNTAILKKELSINLKKGTRPYSCQQRMVYSIL